jgi:hypothetical protein
MTEFSKTAVRWVRLMTRPPTLKTVRQGGGRNLRPSPGPDRAVGDVRRIRATRAGTPGPASKAPARGGRGSVAGAGLSASQARLVSWLHREEA